MYFLGSVVTWQTAAIMSLAIPFTAMFLVIIGAVSILFWSNPQRKNFLVFFFLNIQLKHCKLDFSKSVPWMTPDEFSASKVVQQCKITAQQTQRSTLSFSKLIFFINKLDRWKNSFILPSSGNFSLVIIIHPNYFIRCLTHPCGCCHKVERKMLSSPCATFEDGPLKTMWGKSLTSSWYTPRVLRVVLYAGRKTSWIWTAIMTKLTFLRGKWDSDSV